MTRAGPSSLSSPIFSFRDVIFNLYGEYDNETRSTFLGLWQAVGPLLTPGTEPMLANSVCIQPMANSIQKTRGLFLSKLVSKIIIVFVVFTSM